VYGKIVENHEKTIRETSLMRCQKHEFPMVYNIVVGVFFCGSKLLPSLNGLNLGTVLAVKGAAMFCRPLA